MQKWGTSKSKTGRLLGSFIQKRISSRYVCCTREYGYDICQFYGVKRGGYSRWDNHRCTQYGYREYRGQWDPCWCPGEEIEVDGSS